MMMMKIYEKSKKKEKRSLDELQQKKMSFLAGERVSRNADPTDESFCPCWLRGRDKG